MVYAEQPDNLEGLWRQRVRWGRGDVQITRVFARLWGNRGAHRSMGSLAMAFLWFSIFLMPVFQIGASVSLVAPVFSNADHAWALFRGLWIVAGLVYLAVTAISFAVHWESGRKSWREGILFPGLVSLGVIAHTLMPGIFAPLGAALDLRPGDPAHSALTLLLYAWLALAMAVSWSAKGAERRPRGRWLARPLLLLGGYGPFLCAVTFGSCIKELRGASMAWDKTEKTGKVG